jgi:hypothetical protein
MGIVIINIYIFFKLSNDTEVFITVYTGKTTAITYFIQLIQPHYCNLCAYRIVQFVKRVRVIVEKPRHMGKIIGQ